jgi:hypothetical protein
MFNNQKVYTEQELQIKILENQGTHLFKAIDRIDGHMQGMEARIDTKFNTFMYWMIGLILGSYVLILSTHFIK